MGCSVWRTHCTAPVRGLSAPIDPPEPCPLSWLWPPAKYSVPLAKIPDEIVPSPAVGPAPPMAIGSCQSGGLGSGLPNSRSDRFHVYTMPFLLAAVTSWSPCESVVSVGVVPQSESDTAASNGSCQEPSYPRVLAFSATMAWDWVWV